MPFNPDTSNIIRRQEKSVIEDFKQKNITKPETPNQEIGKNTNSNTASNTNTTDPTNALEWITVTKTSTSREHYAETKNEQRSTVQHRNQHKNLQESEEENENTNNVNDVIVKAEDKEEEKVDE